jgi:phage FluMu protein Com
MIEVACACGNSIKVLEEHAGLSIKCPKCRKLVAVAAPTEDAAQETIPPQGIPAQSLPLETVPPAGLTADEVAAATAKATPASSAPRLDPTGSDPLLLAVERLTAVCRGIRLLLAAILGLLAAQWLVSLLRK